MTREQQIRERAEAATPGPWEWKKMLPPSERLTSLRSTTAFYEEYKGVPRSVLKRLDDMDEADAEFIAHAREDIPWLLSEVAALSARLSDAVTWAGVEAALAVLEIADECPFGNPRDCPGSVNGCRECRAGQEGNP